ncbi:hypothetical protein IKD60_01125 [Candidatus Saccharibacteria bacterium]|nr:hypothetical protein [Candidatus Saccharibacteria bacterium]
MENNNFERNSNSTNTAPTGWESLEQEGRRHDLAEKVKAKFSGETFKRAAQVAMLGIMTAVMLTAAKTDKSAAEKASVATESVDENYGKSGDAHAGDEAAYMDVTPSLNNITPPTDISYIQGDAINNPDTQQWSYNDTDPRFDEGLRAASEIDNSNQQPSATSQEDRQPARETTDTTGQPPLRDLASSSPSTWSDF